jgi:hypothetical protein
VSFFDRYLADAPPPVRRTVPRPAWRQPEAVLPGVAPVELVLARTDDVAIAIPVLLAYPNGFELHLAVRLRSPDDGHRLGWALHGGPAPGGLVTSDEVLRLAVVYSDGRTATNVSTRHRLPGSDGGLVLVPSGGGGGGGRYDATYWVHPLPPPGSVTLICEWPRWGVTETRVEVPAQVFLDASARAVPLWPEPEEEVYDLEPPDAIPGAATASLAAHRSSLNLPLGPEGSAAPAAGTVDP